MRKGQVAIPILVATLTAAAAATSHAGKPTQAARPGAADLEKEHAALETRFRQAPLDTRTTRTRVKSYTLGARGGVLGWLGAHLEVGTAPAQGRQGRRQLFLGGSVGAGAAGLSAGVQVTGRDYDPRALRKGWRGLRWWGSTHEHGHIVLGLGFAQTPAGGAFDEWGLMWGFGGAYGREASAGIQVPLLTIKSRRASVIEGGLRFGEKARRSLDAGDLGYARKYLDAMKGMERELELLGDDENKPPAK